MEKINVKNNTLDKQYQELLQDILDNGVTKSDRTGTGTISVFGRQIRHKMSEGFPVLTTKKMAWKTMVTELLWFLRGDTNIKFLVDNNCHIWDGDAYKNYLKHNDEVDNYWIKKNPEIKSRWKPYSQEEFINKCKTDSEFSEKWGLQIEERELSLEERYDLIEKDKHIQFVKWESLGTDRIKEVLDKENIPTKLITLEYNNETIESYE